MQKIFWFGFKCFKSKEITSHLFFRIGPFNFNFYNSSGFTSLTPIGDQDFHPPICRHDIELCIISTLIVIFCCFCCAELGAGREEEAKICHALLLHAGSELHILWPRGFCLLSLHMHLQHLLQLVLTLSLTLLGKGTYHCEVALLLTENSIQCFKNQ